MSFFKDFKQDLSQAVNELVSDEEVKDTKPQEEEEEELADDGQNEDSVSDEDEDFDLQMLNELLSDDIETEEDGEDEEDIIEPPEEVEIVEEEPEVVEIDDVKAEEQKIYNKEDDMAMEEAKRMEEEAKEATKEALRGNRASHDKNEVASVNTSEIPADEITEITKGTAIEGNIICEGSMNVNGKIKGNVACRGKLVVSGTIVGASRAAEIYTNNAKIDGDVTSDGSIKIGNGSIIIGNVYGTSAVIGGAVKGDIDVHGPVVIDGTAVVQGNIRSRSVQINNGAAIEGSVSQCYAEIDYAALFDKTFAK